MSTPFHPNAVREAVQALAEQGFDGMAQAMELLLNECMKVERQQALGGPNQRGQDSLLCMLDRKVMRRVALPQRQCHPSVASILMPTLS